MKIQNGFISSSSSSSVKYVERTETFTKEKTVFLRYTEEHEKLLSYDIRSKVSKEYNVFKDLDNDSFSQNLTWKTYSSEAFMRIESFLEATEKLKSAYTKEGMNAIPLYDYSKNAAKLDLYNGFVDVVISFPTTIRLAGLELVNPWNGALPTDEEYNFWQYLPKKFAIFKVNSSKVNAYGEKLTYAKDIAKKTNVMNESVIRPVFYNEIENDQNLVFLGRYDVNWENISSYKCFFKYNENDKISVQAENVETNLGTATWECKELVLRIYKGYDVDFNKTQVKGLDEANLVSGGIVDNIVQYIQNKEIEYGTTVNNKPIDFESTKAFFQTYRRYMKSSTNPDINYLKISSALNDDVSDANPYKTLQIHFGSAFKRRYDRAVDLKFYAGVEYKLGGIQPLLSPDIFSVAEMKMYKYAADVPNNKVYIGEWNERLQELEYYGTGVIKTSRNFWRQQ